MQQYALQEHDILIDHSLAEAHLPRQYVLKIKDMPRDEKPREKLLAHGPASLSTVELVAVILNTGTRKEDVLTMATRVVREYGERTLASHTDAQKLSDDLDVPLGKATQFVACGELGRRFFQKREGDSALIRTAQDVYDYVQDMRGLTKEHLRGLYLNMHRHVIHDETLFIGTVSSNLVHPREVFRPAIEYGAVAVVLVHNHPSGVTEPSQADIAVTGQLIEAGRIVGISLVDHVIIGKHGFTSIELSYD